MVPKPERLQIRVNPRHGSRLILACITIRSLRLWLLPTHALASASLSMAQGTIVYHLYDPPLNYAGVPVPPYNLREVDMNLDGRPDFTIRAGPAQVDVLMADYNRVIALPVLPPDIGSYVVPLAQGSHIGASLDPMFSWVGTNDPPGYAGMSACFDAGCAGLWVGLDAYMGVQLESNGVTQYGWIRILNGGIGSVGYIYEWAYDTRPGAPILAGAVPEPSACALLITGGLLAAWLRKKLKHRPA